MLDVCLHPDVEAELAKGQPLPHHRKDAVVETLRDRPRGITIPISGAFEPSGVCDLSIVSAPPSCEKRSTPPEIPQCLRSHRVGRKGGTARPSANPTGGRPLAALPGIFCTAV